MPIAPPGLTGQRVDALGELVLLPGAAFELAAEHVTIMLLLGLPPLSRLCVRGRLWAFLGWGYGITLVTIRPRSEAQVQDAERRFPTTDPGPEAEETLAPSQNLLQAVCAETRVFSWSKPHSSHTNSHLGPCLQTRPGYQSGTAENEVFLSKLDVPVKCSLVCLCLDSFGLL